MPVEDIKNLQLSKSEFEDAISEIKSAMENEHILQAPPLKTLTGDAVTELDDILEIRLRMLLLKLLKNVIYVANIVFIILLIQNTGRSDMKT